MFYSINEVCLFVSIASLILVWYIYYNMCVIIPDSHYENYKNFRRCRELQHPSHKKINSIIFITQFEYVSKVTTPHVSVCNIIATPRFVHICGVPCAFIHNAIMKLDDL